MLHIFSAPDGGIMFPNEALCTSPNSRDAQVDTVYHCNIVRRHGASLSALLCLDCGKTTTPRSERP